MSRSTKGKKGPGYDYWGKRALSTDCGFGKPVKKMTTKIERARTKQAIHKAKKEHT